MRVIPARTFIHTTLPLVAVFTVALIFGSQNPAERTSALTTADGQRPSASHSSAPGTGTAQSVKAAASGQAAAAAHAAASTNHSVNNSPGSPTATFASVPAWQQDYSRLPDGPLGNQWQYAQGNNNGWGNQEVENYTSNPANVRVEGGNLIIQARKEADGSYTSARLSSQGSLDFTYGKLDIVAKLPTGKGVWPALWLWPTDQKYSSMPVTPSQRNMAWLNNGEIDLFEGTAWGDSDFYASAHSLNHYPGHAVRTGGTTVSNPTGTYHTYSFQWTPTLLRFLVDGNTFYTVSNPGTGFADWPYDQRFHLILNIAMGGTQSQGLRSPAMPNGIDDSGSPWQMSVQSIRYYPLAP